MQKRMISTRIPAPRSRWIAVALVLGATVGLWQGCGPHITELGTGIGVLVCILLVWMAVDPRHGARSVPAVPGLSPLPPTLLGPARLALALMGILYATVWATCWAPVWIPDLGGTSASVMHSWPAIRALLWSGLWATYCVCMAQGTVAPHAWVVSRSPGDAGRFWGTAADILAVMSAWIWIWCLSVLWILHAAQIAAAWFPHTAFPHVPGVSSADLARLGVLCGGMVTGLGMTVWHRFHRCGSVRARWISMMCAYTGVLGGAQWALGTLPPVSGTVAMQWALPICIGPYLGYALVRARPDWTRARWARWGLFWTGCAGALLGLLHGRGGLWVVGGVLWWQLGQVYDRGQILGGGCGARRAPVWVRPALPQEYLGSYATGLCVVLGGWVLWGSWDPVLGPLALLGLGAGGGWIWATLLPKHSIMGPPSRS